MVLHCANGEKASTARVQGHSIYGIVILARRVYLLALLLARANAVPRRAYRHALSLLTRTRHPSTLDEA